MATTNLGDVRYPVGNDVPNIAQYFQNLATDVSSQIVPRFANATERDTKYSAWATATGLTVVNGMVCSVAGVLQRRVGGVWHPMFPAWTDLYVGNTAYSGAAGAAWADLAGMNVNFTAPTGTKLQAELRVPMVRCEANSSVLLRLVVNGSIVDSTACSVGAAASEFPGPTLTGALDGTGSAVAVQAQIKGTGGGGYVRAGENNGPRLRAIAL